MLINLNILNSEEAVIDYKREKLIFNYCKSMMIFMTIISSKNKINRVIRVSNKTIISTHFAIMIFIRFKNAIKLFKKRDYIFTSYAQTSTRFKLKDDVLIHIVNFNLCMI